MAEASAIPPTDDDLLALPDACCAGACGPIFETPLLEQLLHRIRDAVPGRSRLAPTPIARQAAGAEGRTTDD